MRRPTAPMVRIYLAREDHTLWKNHPEFHGSMSVALHSHRTDITMVPLFGQVSNVLINGGSVGTMRGLFRYQFSSVIRAGAGGFEPTPYKQINYMHLHRLDEPTWLSGATPHSVFVPQGERAAWMICESAPVELPNDTVLSTDPHLETWTGDGLYCPMTEEHLAEDMELLSVLSNQ